MIIAKKSQIDLIIMSCNIHRLHDDSKLPRVGNN